MFDLRVLLGGILLAPLIFFDHGALEAPKDCRYLTCRDCAMSSCIWAIYYTGDQNCVASTKSLPGVEADVDDPDKCAKPTCVLPEHSDWSAAGIASLVGGIVGGLLAGFFGGAGLQNWRRGGRRLGYERIGRGRQSWTEFFQAFLCAFADGIRQHDDEAPLGGGDDGGERQAAEQNNRRQMEAERLGRDRNQQRNPNNEPPAPPQMQPQQHQQEVPPGNQPVPPENLPVPAENPQGHPQTPPNFPQPPPPPIINQPGLGIQFAAPHEHEGEDNGAARSGLAAGPAAVPQINEDFVDSDDSDDTMTTANNSQEEERDEGNDGASGNDTENQSSGLDSDDDDDDDEDNNLQVPQSSMVVAATAPARKSTREAAINAAKLIESLRVQKRI